MRWRKLRFWIATSVLAFVVLFAAWLMVGNLSVLKPGIERWVSERTGRDFRIAGRFDLDLGRRSVVVADDIVLGNADWADHSPMLVVGRLEVHVRTGSLFRGPLVIERLELADTELYLEERRDGPPNWVFDSPERTRDTARGSGAGLPVLLKEIFVQSLRIRSTAPYREAPVELAVESLRQSLADDRFVTLTMQGLLGGRRLAAEARLGTWEALLSGANVEYEVDIDIDTLNVRSAGRIDDLVEPERPEIRLSAKGPDIDDLTRILGLGDDGSGTIDLEGSVDIVDDELELRLGGNLGQTRVAASARLPGLTSFDTIDASIEAQGPDLAKLIALSGAGSVARLGAIDATTGAPFELAVDLERRERTFTVRRGELDYADATLRFSAALPAFPALDGGRIALDAEGPDLSALRLLTSLPPSLSGEFSVEFALEVDAAGRELFVFDAATTVGRLSGEGEFDGGDTYFGTTARYDFDVPDAAALADALALTGVTLPAAPLIGGGSIVYDDRGIRLDTPLTATLDGMAARVEGMIVPVPGLAGSSVTVAADGESLATVTALAGAGDGVPPLPVTVRGRIDVGADTVSLHDVSGEIGSAQFSGEARLEPERTLALNFNLKGPALEELLAGRPAIAMKPGPFDLTANLVRSDSTLVLDELTLTRPNGNASLNLEAALPLERETLRFALTATGGDVRALMGRIGSFEPLPAAYSIDVRGQRDGDLLAVDRFDLAIGEAVASASGRLDLRGDVGETRFDLKLDVPDMSAIGRVGDRAFNAQPLGLDADIVGRDKTIEARTFRLRIGESVVDGLLRYVSEPTETLNIAILAEEIAFAPLLEAPPEDGVPRAERGDGRLIPELPLPFDQLGGRQGSLRVGIGRLERGALRLRDFNLDAVLGDGVLEIRDLSFRAASGSLRSTATIGQSGDAGQVEVGLVADNLALGLNEANADLARTADANIKLNASGNDLRALFANLDGAALFDIEGGRTSGSRFLRTLYGDLLNEIVVTINPFVRADPVTPIECIVIPLDIEDGRISNKLSSFIATDKIQLSIRAAVDLDSEKLDIGIRSRPKKVLTISAAELLNPYIKIVGTLAKPVLAVDEQGVLVSGGTAVATGGLSILARAAWDRLGRSGNPCAAARKDAEQALDGRLADIEPPAAEGEVSAP